MTIAGPQRDSATRLRVFRESDFEEDEGPTRPGRTLASGTGTTIRVLPGFAVLEGRVEPGAELQQDQQRGDRDHAGETQHDR